MVERKSRQRADREHRITAAARSIAENEGWTAVTIRRLAEEIEYSQPVLYGHFANRDAIIAAVALEGFREIAAVLQAAASETAECRAALENAAAAYFAFARANPALYEAMFTLPTTLRFAETRTRAELGAAFDALATVVRPVTTEVELATETFWAALHGIVVLEQSGRIRPAARSERIALIVRGLMGR